MPRMPIITDPFCASVKCSSRMKAERMSVKMGLEAVSGLVIAMGPIYRARYSAKYPSAAHTQVKIPMRTLSVKAVSVKGRCQSQKAIAPNASSPSRPTD